MKQLTIFTTAALTATLVALPAGLTAQVTDTTRVPAPTTSAPRPQAVAAATGVVSDSSIIAMLKKAHSEEIAAADLAATKATSERVKKYGEELKNDHAKALQELEAYAQRMAAGGSSSSGMASGMTPTDSARTGRDNSAMSGRRDSTSIVGRDSAPVRDSTSTGRDPSAMAGRRDSSRMVQSDLPPGKDSIGIRRDSVMTGRDTTLSGRMTRDSINPARQSGMTSPVGGQQGYAAPPSDPGAGLQNLQSLSGKEFDQQFIQQEVAQHQEEINHLRNDVIPLIKDSGLRSLVQGSLTTMGKHLRDGQAIEQYLKTR